MSSLKPNDTIENEDRMLNEFSSPTCFNETYDQLMNRIEPLDEDIQVALGLAVEAFPQLLPKVFKTYRSIGKRMIARQAEERRKDHRSRAAGGTTDWEQHPRVHSTPDDSLENNTSKEPWDAELRMTLTDQLIEFLQQNTSTEPEYLVRSYEQHLQSTYHCPKQTVEGEVWW